VSGGLRKRIDPYLKIPSTTIRDRRLSFRARGVLAYLLDMPNEWDVRSEVIAANGKEGRGAVRTALHELGEHGYYRIERRQLRTGKFAMGTAVSEQPVPEWAEQYAEYASRPVPVIEQTDGSFKVKRKDGTLVPDGFVIDVSAGQTEDRKPVAGEPVPGPPDSGQPDSGSPQDGSLVALSTTETDDTEAGTDDSLRSPSAHSDDGDGDGQTPEPAAEPDTAQTILGGFIDYLRANDYGQLAGRVKGHLAREIKSLLDDGFHSDRVKIALVEWYARGLHPSALASVAQHVGHNRPAPPRRRPNDIDWDAAMTRAQAKDAARREAG
jgi:hypothetical protein